MNNELNLEKCVLVPIESIFLTGIEEIDNNPTFVEMRKAILTPNTSDNRKSIYLVEFADGIIKIGVSKDPINRIKTIINQSGRIFINEYITKPLLNSFNIEAKIKSKYKNNKINGEYFSLNFEEIKKEIMKEVESYE